MGLDIGIKLNKAISSDILRDKFYSWQDINISDDIYCLSRGFCNMVLSFNDNTVISALNEALKYDCSFLKKPKANHCEEDESTRFQFGWVSLSDYLIHLKNLKTHCQQYKGYSKHLQLGNDWQYYFDEEGDNDFQNDIETLIAVLEVGQEQGATEICYSIG